MTIFIFPVPGLYKNLKLTLRKHVTSPVAVAMIFTHVEEILISMKEKVL